MFRRRTTLLAAAVLAAWLFATPGTARAQFFYGGGGIYFGDPSWNSFGTGYMYYPFRNTLNRPALANGFGGLTPPGVSRVGLGNYVTGYGGLLGGYGGYFGDAAGPYVALGGLNGYGSFMSPFSYGAWVSPFTLGNTSLDFSSYGAFPSYLAPNYYANSYWGYAAPSLHPSWIYPNYAGYSSLYPSYARVGNYAAPLHGGFVGWPLPSGTPATFTSGLSSLYAPGLNLNSYLSDITTPGGVTMVNPSSVSTNGIQTGSGIRPSVFGNVVGSTAPPREKLTADAGGIPAKIMVTLPTEDTKLWFQGVATNRTGKVREFESPPLVGATNFNYELRIQYRHGDETVTQTRSVPVRAGDRVRVDFTANR